MLNKRERALIVIRTRCTLRLGLLRAPASALQLGGTEAFARRIRPRVGGSHLAFRGLTLWRSRWTLFPL
jgi:hypothetical protein